MVYPLQHPILGEGVLHLVLLEDDVLAKNLDGVDAFGALLARQNHTAERTFAQSTQEFKTVQ